MRFLSKFLQSLMLFICSLWLMSCSEHHSDEANDDSRNPSVYLTLQINTASDDTRAGGPSGGESGDGTEDGINNESKIERLVLFFFRADQATSVDDRSNAENVPVIMEFCENVSVINQSSQTTWNTQPIELKNLEGGREYFMAAVANAYHFQFADIRTLKDLQDYEFTAGHWNDAADITAYSRFIMTSRYRTPEDMEAAKVTLNFGNDYYNPATATLTMERLAARIDIIPVNGRNATWNNNGYYVYTPTGTSDAVYLTGLQLINKYNQGSYLLKHLADATAEGEIDYTKISLIGTEKMVNGVQTNYVVDPRTSLKTGLKYPSWYDNYYNMPFGWKPVEQRTAGNYYILDYTQENTVSREHQEHLYQLTSLSLQCTYVPKDYVPGKTFYVYRDATYSNTADLVWAINTPGVTEENVLQTEGVDIYENGVCYYTYPIRHSDLNNSNVNDIMKYGIVRNNIYRITINSFSGIGTSTPVLPLPITQNVNITLWVMPWNVVQNPEIIL